MPFLPPNQQRQSTEGNHADVADGVDCPGEKLLIGRWLILLARTQLF